MKRRSSLINYEFAKHPPVLFVQLNLPVIAAKLPVQHPFCTGMSSFECIQPLFLTVVCASEFLVLDFCRDNGILGSQDWARLIIFRDQRNSRPARDYSYCCKKHRRNHSIISIN